MKLNNSIVLRVTLVASLFAIASLATACGGDDDGATADAEPGTPDGGGADAPISAPCQEATTHSDFTWINENILTKSCVFSGCHNAASHEEGLDLSAANSFAHIVGVASTQVTSKKLIDGTSADCANSYLYEKITGENLKPGTVKMPKAQPALCQEKIDAVCRWIAAGAKND
jgi:hypothetical protein